MPYAAALSEHPLATHAVGEVVGQVLEALGPAPDLAVLFVTDAHAGALEDVAGAVRALLRPTTLIGCTTVSAVGPGREVEERPAVSLWAGNVGPAAPVRLVVAPTAGASAITGWPASPPIEPAALLLLADPSTFPTEQFLDGLRDQVGDPIPVVGGVASAGAGPGAVRLVLDGQVLRGGAVGVLLGERAEVASVVSQGCRPVGQPFTVTRAEGRIVYELGGRPALERVQELVDGLGPDDRELLRQGVHLGRVIDEGPLDPGRGDFLVRTVLGADRDNGAIAVGDTVEVGATVQFQVRDANSADQDLRELLAARTADGALVFTCNGRGRRLFGESDHDAEVVAELLDDPPTAGMFCAGEIGPVGPRNFLHSFTASVVLFTDR